MGLPGQVILCGRAPLRLFVRALGVLILFSATGLCRADTFKDDLGRVVRLEKPPARIVSMAPSVTEILYYMGLGDRIAGVTQFSYYPPEALRKPKVGSYISLNVERIISLGPDLAIGTADGNKPAVVELLEKAGIPVYVVNPRSVGDAIRIVSALGELCGVGERARDLSSALEARVNFISRKVSHLNRPLVFLQINSKPIMTVNRYTLHHDVIRLAGGDNMAGDESVVYPRLSLEAVIGRRPQVIVISSMERGGRFEQVRREWQKWPVIPAVKNRRIHMIDSDLLDRPSPRIVKGLEAMARLIHPQVEWYDVSGRKGGQ
jgi:iron complex transport system substrate-binding protein